MSTKLSNIVKGTFSRMGFIFKEKKKIFLLIISLVLLVILCGGIISILGKPSSLFSACLLSFFVISYLPLIYSCYSGVLVAMYHSLKSYDDNEQLSHSFKWWFKEVIFFSLKYLAVSLILFLPIFILSVYLFWMNKIGYSVPVLLKILGSIFYIVYGIISIIIHKLVVPVLLFVHDGGLLKKIKLTFQLFNLHKLKIIWYFFVFAAFSFLITSCIGLCFMSVASFLGFMSIIVILFRVFVSLILTPSLVMSLYRKLSEELEKK